MPINSYSDLLNWIGKTNTVGGTSGVLFSIFFFRFSKFMKSFKNPTIIEWAEGFKVATKAISEIGGAKIGDATMIGI